MGHRKVSVKLTTFQGTTPLHDGQGSPLSSLAIGYWARQIQKQVSPFARLLGAEVPRDVYEISQSVRRCGKAVRNGLVTWAVLCVGVSFAGVVRAQSVGELAVREAKRRAASTHAPKVITNADLPGAQVSADPSKRQLTTRPLRRRPPRPTRPSPRRQPVRRRKDTALATTRPARKYRTHSQVSSQSIPSGGSDAVDALSLGIAQGRIIALTTRNTTVSCMSRRMAKTRISSGTEIIIRPRSATCSMSSQPNRRPPARKTVRQALRCGRDDRAPLRAGRRR